MSGLPPTDINAAQARIKALLEAGQFAAAADLARTAAQLWPKDLRAHFLCGETLERDGRHAEALQFYAELAPRFPGNAWLAARQATALAMTGKGGQAVALFHEAIRDSSLTEDQKTQIARRIAAPLRRRQDAAAMLAERVLITPGSAALLREAGSAAASTGQPAKAIEYIDRSEALEPLPHWASTIRLDTLSKLARQAATWPIADARIIAALTDALLRHPRNPLFVRQLNRLPVSSRDWNALYPLVRAAAEQPSTDGFFLFESALAALQHGEIPFATQLLQRLEPGTRWGIHAQPLIQVMAAVSDARWSQARLVDDKAAEIQHVSVPNAQGTLLVFATLTGNFMMLPLAMLDALLAPLPLNVIYLRDTTSLAPGMRGFRSFGPGIEDSILRLRHEITTLGAPRLLTMGASASGLSAIRYGARLGAERAVTFGALTSLGQRAGDPASGSRQAAAPIDAMSAERFRSLATELAEAPDMRVAFHYGAACPLDAAHAGRVTTIPGITIHPVVDVEHHYVFLSMIANGTFPDAIWR